MEEILASIRRIISEDDAPAAEVEYLMTTRGAEPLSLRSAPIDYDHYLEKQLAPEVDVVLGTIHTAAHKQRLIMRVNNLLTHPVFEQGIDQAVLDNAKLQLEYSRIVSPIDGVAGIRQVDQGNLVHQADAAPQVANVLTDAFPDVQWTSANDGTDV